MQVIWFKRLRRAELWHTLPFINNQIIMVLMTISAIVEDNITVLSLVQGQVKHVVILQGHIFLQVNDHVTGQLRIYDSVV